MQSPAIDLHPQHLLQAHVAQLNLGTEVVYERELAGLVGCLEQHRLKAKGINERWTSLFAGKMTIDEFKSLANDSKAFSSVVMEACEVEKARMLEIMMAQDFQDITGQLIKKIVGITAVAERELAQLLRDNAPPEVKAAIEAEKPADLMSGPSAPGAAMEQNDVDDLLDSLGF